MSHGSVSQLTRWWISRETEGTASLLEGFCKMTFLLRSPLSTSIIVGKMVIGPVGMLSELPVRDERGASLC